MTDQTILVNQHAVLSIRHPLAASLANRLRFANPVWENALRAGRRPPEGTPQEIVLWDRVGDHYHFPRGVADKLKHRFPVIDQTVPGEDADMPFLLTLRDYQRDPLADVLAALRGGFGTVLQAQPGWGKTIGWLWLASQLGKKALILVHKEFLMTQWVERILGTVEGRRLLGVKSKAGEVYAPALGIAPHEVGIVQQDRAEFAGRKIVVAMAQSLHARDYAPEFYEGFGLVGIDEVHRFAAPTFQAVIKQFPAAKRLGVTATPKRKDGLEDIFFAHLGPVSAVGAVPRATPRINIVRTPARPTEADEKRMKRFGRTDNVKVIDYITTHAPRNALIVKLLLQAAEKGRKILVLSERRDHLDLLKEQFTAACQRDGRPFSTDYYVGGMDLAERTRAEQMQVLFATWHMAEEGLDIATLDTLFMVTPRTGVEQAVGRILRLNDTKMAPVVVDFLDGYVPSLKKRYEKREAEYKTLKWLDARAA